MVGDSSNDSVGGGSGRDDQSLDVVFDVLAHQRRRHTLDCLEGVTEPVTVSNLAEYVAVRERDRPITEISNGEFETVLASLNHTHLPKLESAGAVEYDQEHDLVQTARTPDLTQRILSFATDGETVDH